MKVVFSVTIDGAEVTFFDRGVGPTGSSYEDESVLMRIRVPRDGGSKDLNEDFYMSSTQIRALKKAFKALEAMKI